VNEETMRTSLKTEHNSGDALNSAVVQELEIPLQPPAHPIETMLSLIKEAVEDKTGAIADGDVGFSDHLSGSES